MSDIYAENHQKDSVEPAPKCELCNDSGTVGKSTAAPYSYRGPGPIPDYAKGVWEAFCSCDLGQRLFDEECSHQRRMSAIIEAAKKR